MHVLLFGANFLYVFYELQYSYIHLYFLMLYCTDMVGVWGVYLIIRGNGGEVKGVDRFLYHLVSIVLTATLLIANYWPERGVMCHKHYPVGLAVIVCFYIFWSFYVFCKLRDPAFLAPAVEQTEEEIEAIEKAQEELPIS